MRFKYSPEADILTVHLSEAEFALGEDNEGVIVCCGMDGAPSSLEILDARSFVMFANASLVTGEETTNPNVPEVSYTKRRDASTRAIPKGDADLRFKYHADSDTLAVKLGDGESHSCRNSQEVTVYYDDSELPVGLEIAGGRAFVLGAMQSVLLQQEVSVV